MIRPADHLFSRLIVTNRPDLDNFRVADITGQSLPVFMASRMMDVLWSDLHMTHQSRS